jgi:hypothetical protein
MDRTLAEQAKSLAVADRWELTAELWESMESEDFPIAPEIQALLHERRAEYAGLPLEGPTLADITAEWHRKQR